MTAPGGSVGDGYIRFHADTKRVQPELEAALNKATADADDIMEKAGTRWGEKVSEGTSKEIEKHGDDFVAATEKSLKGKTVSLKGVKYKIDERGFLHDFDTGRFAGRLVGDMVDSLNNAVRSRSGGLGFIGSAISDAIGAGFNVSGKSPLIAFLIPAVGAIIELVLAAIQAVNALIAALLVIPPLLGAMAIQGAVVFLAFDGMGEAIKNAFKAETVEDFNKAIKDLQPSAQDFVRALVPLREIFNELKKSVQEDFFAGFRGEFVFEQLGEVLDKLTKSSDFQHLARELGFLFRELALFFASPSFVRFVENILPATNRFLSRFSDTFIIFLTGLIDFATDMIPSLERVGMGINDMFETFGKFLSNIGSSPAFQQWLDDMFESLKSLGDVLGAAIGLIVTLFDTINDAGGKELLDTLAEVLNVLSFYLASEHGKKAIEGLIHVSILALQSFTGLLLIIFEIVAGIEFIAEKLKEFWHWLTGDAGPELEKTWRKIGGNIQIIGSIVRSVGSATAAAITTIGRGLGTTFSKIIPGIIRTITDLPGKMASIAFKAGTSLINNLIAGVRNRLPSLQDIANHVANIISMVLPGSPAKEGPLSGEGYALFRGQHLVQDLASGMESQIPDLMQVANNVAGSIFNTNLNFFGQQPTETQARTLARAASSELNQQIMQREIRLQVRAM